MKKIFILMLILIAWAASLSAQTTREQADAIVLNYLKTEAGYPYNVFVNVNTPNEEGFVITTSNEETVRAKYACWVYLAISIPPVLLHGTVVPPHAYRCLFVKEDNGSLLEINAMNNSIPDLTDWEGVNALSGIVESKENNITLLYPNPVGNLLTIPCNGDQARVEIYDLKGTCLFSELLSGEDACQLNVSFLNTGVYMVNISGETYRIIKK